MSVSTWCLYSVSAISMPATKAPSASDRPACSVSQARPSVTSSRLSMNSSSLLRRATSVSHQRITLLAADQQQRQQRRRLHAAPSRARSAMSPPLASERRDQHQQRHHGQILEQQHAHHAAAVLGFELQPLGHQLDDDGGAATSPARRRAPPRPASPAPRACRLKANSQTSSALPSTRAGDRQHHLRQAQAEHQLAHAAQLGQVELQPDHEHQEHDAELGQVLDAGRVLGQRQRVRADQHADHQVAQHRRQLQRAADHHAEHRGDQVQQDEFEGRWPCERGDARCARPRIARIL